MSIKESALAAITSITSSDFIRAVTSAGASRRITLANLANFILRNYAPSTSSPTSGSVQEQINSLNSKTQLSSVYTQNDYVSETSFNRNWAHRVGNLLVCTINMTIDKAAFPSGNSYDNTVVGSINGWNRNIAVNICGQNPDAGILVLTITENGSVNLTNRSGKNCSGFYRTTIVVPAA